MYEPYSSADAGQNGNERRQLLQRWQSLKTERFQWWDTWRDLGDNLLPDSVRFYLWDRARAGMRHDNDLINSTPQYAVRVLAAGMMAGITSPARPWFRLTTPNPVLAESPAVKNWLSDIEERIRATLARSNVYKQLSKMYYDLAVFGQSPMMIEEDPDDIIRATLYPVGSYALATNSRGQVDTMFRECGMTVRQLVDKFGLKALSSQSQAAYKSVSRHESVVDLLHIVTTRDDDARKGQGGRAMPYKSCWLELNADSKSGLLGESGFNEFPVMAPRWETTAENVYGTGNPGRQCLGDVKQLQLMESRKLQLIEKLADPPMQAPSNMRMERISLMPGDINYVGSGNPSQKFAPAYEMHPQALQGIREEIAAVEGRVRSAFFADLWLMFSESDGGQPITAREVAEKHDEKMLQLGPVMENLEDELLDPLIDRVFGVLLRGGYLPPAPRELAGAGLRVEYISMMAQAQKLLGTANIERLLGTVGNVYAVDQSVIDNIDLDEAVRSLGDMYGVMPRIIRTKDQVAKIRAQRASAQADQQKMQAMMGAAQSAQVLSQAKMGDDNALTRMVNNAGPIVGAAAGR